MLLGFALAVAGIPVPYISVNENKRNRPLGLEFCIDKVARRKHKGHG